MGRPKKPRITIATGKGNKDDVIAERVEGCFAVAKIDDGQPPTGFPNSNLTAPWHLTHVPTGYHIGRFLTKESAFKALWKMLASELPWDIDDPSEIGKSSRHNVWWEKEYQPWCAEENKLAAESRGVDDTSAR